jgi:hypothetical protein
MVNDLQLEMFDKVTMVKSQDVNGTIIARVYVEKNPNGRTARVRQGTEPVPMVDTARGANTSAAHAAAHALPSSANTLTGKKTIHIRKDNDLKRAIPSIWMKNITPWDEELGLVRCKLITPGLGVPVGKEWGLELTYRRSWLKWDGKKLLIYYIYVYACY